MKGTKPVSGSCTQLQQIASDVQYQGGHSRESFKARNTSASQPSGRVASAVATPVWFGEDEDKIYVMTRSDSGKYKRIRNNPQVLVAPCTMRGKITGPDFRGDGADIA